MLQMLWTCNGIHLIFIYISIKVQMFLTLWRPYVMFFLNSLVLLPQLSLMWQCHPVVFFCLCSLNYLSCGDVICGTIIVYLTTCTTVGTTNGSTLRLIIFCALKSVLSCSLFTFEPKAPLSSTLFFLLKALLGKSSATYFFLFSSVI
jgi:hypothetical protein